MDWLKDETGVHEIKIGEKWGFILHPGKSKKIEARKPAGNND